MKKEFAKNIKNEITLLILILMLATSALAAITPTSMAQVDLKNNAYLDVHPNPTGVNQQVVVNR